MTVIRMQPGETEDAFVDRVARTAPPLSDDEADEVWALLWAAKRVTSERGVA